MPATLLPNDAIPELAARLQSSGILPLLQRLHEAGVIRNSHALDPETARGFQRLAELGVADLAYEGQANGTPYLWASNENGVRVLNYLTGIRSGPHYEIPSPELAAWLEQQGIDVWWNVDGDSLLTGRLSFPCPGDELAAELRRIDRPLLVQAKEGDAEAKGQMIDAAHLDRVVGRFSENRKPRGTRQKWAEDRLLYLCWKGSHHDWLLTEDSRTTEQSRIDAASITR
jgi:hypothetical protein